MFTTEAKVMICPSSAKLAFSTIIKVKYPSSNFASGTNFSNPAIEFVRPSKKSNASLGIPYYHIQYEYLQPSFVVTFQTL